MNETYRKVLQIFVMKNYAALIAKLQSRNLPLPRDYFAMSALCSIHVPLQLGICATIYANFGFQTLSKLMVEFSLLQ